MRTRVELKVDAKAQLEGKRGKGALIVLLMFLIGLIPSIIGLFIESDSIYIALDIVFQIYISLLGIGCFLFYLSVRRNKEVSVNMLFSGYEYYLKGFLVILLVKIITIIGCILLIIPSIIFSFMYSQALYIYIENPEMGVIECLRTSRLAMKGHKFELFVLNLSFIGWIFLSVLTLGILSLYVTPYIKTTLVNYYTDVMEDYRVKQIII